MLITFQHDTKDLLQSNKPSDHKFVVIDKMFKNQRPQQAYNTHYGTKFNTNNTKVTYESFKNQYLSSNNSSKMSTIDKTQ